MKIVAVIAAGGIGSRISNSIPKQFIKHKNKELIAWTLEVFQKCSLIDEITIAVNKKYIQKIFDIKKKYKLSKISNVLKGGKERQDSVFNALSSMNLKDEDLLVVHDAARPLLPIKILETAIQKAIKKNNAVVAIKAKDTLVRKNNVGMSYINRSEVYYLQTPQIFYFKDLLKAMQLAVKEKYLGTDESMLMNRAGFEINLVEGSSLNFKITTDDDLEIFKKLVK